MSLFFSNTGPGRALMSVVHSVPLIGKLLQWGTGPFSLAMYTYLLGMAFVHHFETGGSFESFDRRQFGAYLQREVKERLGPRPLFSVN